jgi:hypothetical protein
MFSKVLVNDPSFFSVEAYGKAARFVRLLRLREKRLGQSNFSAHRLSFKTLEKDLWPVVTDMACSFICVSCNSFGMDIDHFFPFSFTSLSPSAVISHEKSSDEILDSSVVSAKLDEGYGSILYSTAVQSSSKTDLCLDFEQISLDVSSMKPIDPIETVELSDAVLALFELSHQPESELRKSVLVDKAESESCAIKEATLSIVADHGVEHPKEVLSSTESHQPFPVDCKCGTEQIPDILKFCLLRVFLLIHFIYSFRESL